MGSLESLRFIRCVRKTRRINFRKVGLAVVEPDPNCPSRERLRDKEIEVIILIHVAGAENESYRGDQTGNRRRRIETKPEQVNAE
jgi:hypothetical protein